jgi:phosphatidylserine decarboxylase
MKKRSAIIWITVLMIITVLLISFNFYFLRDPEITIPGNENDILSPASGKIIKIAEINASELDRISIEKGLVGKINTRVDDICKDSCIMVSIFMTPLDVHIQRASLSGKVLSIEHKSGTFKITNTFENGLTNEKTETIIENSVIGKFKIIQIAGLAVRRIESFTVVGESLERGERIGLIRYGSQVSIILPKENVEITSSEGEHVESGSSIIGRIKKA